MTEKDWEKRFE